ncbi:MAG: SRPBCC domain-containing protein [Elusimicrobia bacterium]|nr:SRPBCC domain-containing protein [Candidatus Liberimonas magnetica]
MVAKTKTRKELRLVHVFDAPRELVWKAWTEPEYLKKWWGPKDFTAPFINVDLRAEGKYLFCMRSPEGKDFWSTGVYKEIIKPERLVMTDSFADEKGNVVPASHYGLGEGFPLELQITVAFEEVEGKTNMVLEHAGMPKGEMLKLAKEGWNQSFDKLAGELSRIKNETEGKLVSKLDEKI